MAFLQNKVLHYKATISLAHKSYNGLRLVCYLTLSLLHLLRINKICHCYIFYVHYCTILVTKLDQLLNRIYNCAANAQRKASAGIGQPT